MSAFHPSRTCGGPVSNSCCGGPALSRDSLRRREGPGMKGSREALERRRMALRRMLTEMDGGDVGDTSYARALIDVLKADLEETDQHLKRP